MNMDAADNTEKLVVMDTREDTEAIAATSEKGFTDGGAHEKPPDALPLEKIRAKEQRQSNPHMKRNLTSSCDNS